MNRRPRAVRSLAVVAALLATTAPALLASAPAACAASPSHAGLVVDTGQEVVEYCVAMPGGSVSGTQLIQLAADQHALEYRLGFGGKAVCMLDGVGTSSGDCFDQFPNFWGYWRAGSSGDWAWSSTGAADTSVESGDLEGWVWGTGQDARTHAAPPATTIAQLCGTGATPPPRGGGSGDGHGHGHEGGGPGAGTGGGGDRHGGGTRGGGGGGQQQTGSAANGAGSTKSGAPDAPGSSAATTGGEGGGGSRSAPKESAPSGEAATGLPEPTIVITEGAATSGPESTEAALAGRTTDAGGVPFGALLALAAALALGIGGALLVRRSGPRGR